MMGFFLDYLLKANLVLTVFSLAYHFLLRKEKFLLVNRFLLLGILFAIGLLPLCPALYYGELSSRQVFFKLIDLHFNLFTVMADKTVQSVNYDGWIIFLYVLVVLILFLRFFIQLLKLSEIIRNSSKQEIKETIICEPAAEVPPFSFFNFIVVRRVAFTPEQYDQIISHESCHSRQLHSIDVLLTEMLCIFLWMNPLVYFFRRQLKLNLEFIADEYALRSGINAKSYQFNLLNTAGKCSASLPSNLFHSSRIKQRIAMINKDEPGFLKAYKYILLIPLLTALYLVVNGNQGQSLVPEPKYYSNDEELIFIDARTNIIRFKAGKTGVKEGYKGIYVIDGNIYSEEELHDLLKASGRFNLLLGSKPVIGFYSENDKNAIQKWGSQASKGVIFIESAKVQPVVNH